jgi:hypothetical protein
LRASNAIGLTTASVADEVCHEVCINQSSQNFPIICAWSRTSAPGAVASTGESPTLSTAAEVLFSRNLRRYEHHKGTVIDSKLHTHTHPDDQRIDLQGAER